MNGLVPPAIATVGMAMLAASSVGNDRLPRIAAS